MSKRKPGYFMVDGEFAVWPDGSYIDVCDFGNCRQPVKEKTYLYCVKHDAAEVWKYKICKNCHKRSMPHERGINICQTPGCGAGNWVF